MKAQYQGVVVDLDDVLLEDRAHAQGAVDSPPFERADDSVE